MFVEDGWKGAIMREDETPIRYLRMGIENMEPLLKPQEAAELLSVKEQTLAYWRCSDREGAPPYIRACGTIRYRLSDLEKWVEENLVSGPAN